MPLAPPPKIHQHQRVRYLLDGEEIFHQIHDLLSISTRAFFAFWEADPEVCLDYTAYVTKTGVDPLKLKNVLLKNPNNPHLKTHICLWHPSLIAQTRPDQKHIKHLVDEWTKLGKQHKDQLTVTTRYHSNYSGSWHQKFIVFEVPLVTLLGTKFKDLKGVGKLPRCYVSMIIGTNLSQSYVDSATHPYEAELSKCINGGSTAGFHGWHDAGVVILGDFGLDLLKYFAKFDPSVTVDESAGAYQQSTLDGLMTNLVQSEKHHYGGGYELVDSAQLLCNDYDAKSYGTGLHRKNWERREITDAYVKEIKNAAEHIHIESFYVTDEEIVKALRGKLLTGCTVRILTCGPDTASGGLTPGSPEFNRWANDMLGAGVKKQVKQITKKTGTKVDQGYFEMIWPRIKGEPERPIFVHSKLLVCDWKVMVIGTCNFNTRSTRMDGEIAVRIRGQAFCTAAAERNEQHLQDHTILADVVGYKGKAGTVANLVWKMS